jgi:hypothetical protein
LVDVLKGASRQKRLPDGVILIRLAVLLVLLSAVEISTEGYVVVDPPEAVVCELGWCYVLEPEMTWRVNDTRN